jgi:hypothetical protein
MFKVSRLTREEVYSNERLNSNNLWEDEGRPKPANYLERLRKTRTSRWVSPSIPTITLDAEDTKWMAKCAMDVGCITGRFSKLYEDNLKETVKKHEAKFPPLDAADKGWFVRTETVSLKGGEHGVGPYNNLTKVIESICSSNLGHMCIHAGCENLDAFPIYFFPWIEIAQEFRVFVYQNRISAISTQHWSAVHEDLHALSDAQVGQIGQKIIDYFCQNLQTRLAEICGPDYTMDIAILADGSPYFIEPNGFGADFAAGSAAFSWVDDAKVIHGKEGDPVEIRFVDREE